MLTYALFIDNRLTTLQNPEFIVPKSDNLVCLDLFMLSRTIEEQGMSVIPGTDGMKRYFRLCELHGMGKS